MIHITNNRSICDSLRGVLGAMLLLLSLTGCEKDTEPSNFAPALTTGTATDIYRVGATLSGSINRSEATVVQEYGILLSELKSMAEYNELKATDGNNSFSLQVQNLQPGKTYYYCAYAYSGYSHARGEVKEFTTTESNAPVFGEPTATSVGEESANLSCRILDEGGSELSLSGFCYKERSAGGEPTVNDHVVNVAPSGGALTAALSGLNPDTEYNIRAYAVNGSGIGYSKTLTLTTKASTKRLATVGATTVNNITTGTATVEAAITDEGGCALLSKGFCWSSESATPTVSNTKLEVTTEGLTLTAELTGLQQQTTYYVRAYAENEKGIAYGEVQQFTTQKEIVLPTLSAVTVGEVTPGGFTVSASVTDAGGGTVSERGFCYVVGQGTPTIADNKLTATGEDSAFQATATGLSPQTVYIIRAYATNEKGTAYSDPMVVTTKKADPEEGDAVYPEKSLSPTLL